MTWAWGHGTRAGGLGRPWPSPTPQLLNSAQSLEHPSLREPNAGRETHTRKRRPARPGAAGEGGTAVKEEGRGERGAEGASGAEEARRRERGLPLHRPHGELGPGRHAIRRDCPHGDPRRREPGGRGGPEGPGTAHAVERPNGPDRRRDEEGRPRSREGEEGGRGGPEEGREEGREEAGGEEGVSRWAIRSSPVQSSSGRRIRGKRSGSRRRTSS